MKKIFQSLIVLVVFGLLFTACSESFIEQEPTGEISNEKATSSFMKLTLSVNGLYAILMDNDYYGEVYVLSPEVIADNVKRSTQSGTNRYTGEYNLTYGATDGPVDTWVNGYYLITSASNVINAIEGGGYDQQTATDADINNLLGEALFLRALTHFDLCRFFAHHYTLNDQTVAENADGNGGHLGVPIITITKIGEPARNTVKEVYEQVLADLNKALPLLTIDKGHGYASANAAKALLARVYLYMENYQKAAEMANAVIESGEYSITPAADFAAYWAAEDANETIFQVVINSDDEMYSDAGNNPGGIYLQPYGDLCATNQLGELYEEGDVRLEVCSLDGKGEYRVYKFPGKTGTVGNEQNNIKIFRLSEMYLIRAEANFKASTTIGATPLDDINAIRNNRNIKPLTEISESDIALERRKELAFEGHRAFDLARTGSDNIRPECFFAPKVEYPNYKYIFPIPMDEMERNENMKQNLGY